MNIIRCKIQRSEDDGDFNIATGTSYNRGYVLVGNWATISSCGLFRFSNLPFIQGAKINKAILNIYLEDLEPKEDRTGLDFLVSVSLEGDARDLTYGANRSFSYYQTYSIDSINPNQFLGLDVTNLVQKKVNELDWKNSILFKIEINNGNFLRLLHFSSAESSLYGSAELYIEYDQDKEVILETSCDPKDDIIVSGTKLSTSGYYLGELKILPDHISASENLIFNPYEIIKNKTFDLTIESKINFELAETLLDLVGTYTILKTPDDVFNVLIKGINLNFRNSYLDSSLNLVVLRGEKC